MNSTRFALRATALSSLCAALLLSACADMTPNQKGTAVGAGIGAVAGAAIGGNAEGTAIGAGLGALGGYVWSRHMQEKKAAMERATAGTGVAVTQTADNQLKLNIPSDISFDTGRADIKPSLRPVLDQFANGLGAQPNTEIRIIGHTDSTGPDSVNDPLSLQRAASARDYLAAHGVDPQRVMINGRGEHEPIADNSTEAGRARNRRVEIYLAERSVASR
ncbi:MAG: OmpA family protein [Ramlibacter sp.]|nr:OmpA family protein [Ramlibacter sp.]MBX3659211.1 OmpA family protein [Ramlibacter sp.]